MAELPDVDALRADWQKKKDALTKKWAKTMDEEGTFVFVFGDPKSTPCTYYSANIIPSLL